MTKLRNEKWTREEAIILFDAYIQVMKGYITKEEAVKHVSQRLRKIALDNNKLIDETYRNENGISMQFENINYIVSDGKYGLPNASQLFKNLVSDYLDVLYYKSNHSK